MNESGLIEKIKIKMAQNMYVDFLIRCYGFTTKLYD